MSNEDDDVDARVIANLREMQQRNAVRPDLPPLRLHHFFVLIAVTAVVLTVSRSMFERLSSSTNGVQVPQPGIATWTIGAVVLGGQITVSAFVIVWRLRKTIGQLQPGEWLSLIPATEGAFSLLWWALFFPLNNINNTSSFLWLSGLMTCLQVFWGVLLLVLLVRSRENLFWKTAYLILLVGRLLPLLLTFVRFLLPGSTYFAFMSSYGRIANYIGYVHWLMIPAICAAVVADRVQKRERRWTHWLGAVLYVVQAIQQIVMMLWMTYGASAGGGSAPNPPASSP